VFTPLRFVPFLRPMVWGGRRLGEFLGKQLPTEEPYGESWEISDHPLHFSVVADGPLAGRSLRELMASNAGGLLGSAAGNHTTFPWLVKFLDARDRLSVQVHPDADAVRRLAPGERSKSEAWVVLDAAPGSRIWAGLLPGVTEAKLRDALRQGTVADCLHQFTPRPGDCVYLPAGTVHAVGGVLLAEIQETSDATFRLFDWNRRDSEGNPRRLHIEEAIASIHWQQAPVSPVRAFEPGAKSRRRLSLVRCPHFHLDCLQEDQPFRCGGTNRVEVLVIVQGAGHWSTPAGDLPLRAGEAWVLPAALAATECVPQGQLGALLCKLPD
jgi:mannose-6-phosphate isomerase